VLYEKNSSKHTYNGQTRKGRSAIYAFYNDLFKKKLPGAKFSVIGSSQSGNTFTLQWKATAAKARVQRGKDTIVLSSANLNLIAQHTTSFTVSKSLEPRIQLSEADHFPAGPIPV
jgi:hypothetical protein